MTTSANLPTREPRRFSIRLPRPLWIGLATAAAIIVGIVLRFGVPIYQQQVAVGRIERRGGRVVLNPRGPNWLRRLVGEAWTRPFDRVRVVEMYGTAADDSDLAHLRSLADVTYLNLRDTQISDDGVAYLAGLTSLESLILKRTRITDHGLAHLSQLKCLKYLNLEGTAIGDGGIEHLKGLRSLERLSLCRTRVGDVGIWILSQQRGLRVLWLRETKITNAAIDNLKPMASLKEVNLLGTRVTLNKMAEFRHALPSAKIGTRRLYGLPGGIVFLGDPQENHWR